ncbi:MULTISPECIES: hypothetical protein [Priestia]|uniref:Uncharacterized protein n=1 Tax=Priestia aryabhattai TaxID=412384 RepID=A0A7W3NGA6_PRIAR|nr:MULTISPECIES: hypothetical protein [Priestia]MCJ7983548.1 hypothetical protein [Priestia sp. OVL9]MBA9042459.1 hypothetical protein [Priestia aryabhattai]MCJ7983618.1 hypothetical protein [Priestia sp. OVL9]MDH3161428.1 hypothetical protein [Priestia megaterium]MED4116937.1 hypothetical protein [Priestia megaterium]
MKYVCPVCGYKNLEEAAYDESGLASFEICICCGFQFGDDDDVEIEEGVFMDIPETHRLHRKKWIQKGAPVFNTKYYPKELQSNGQVKEQYLTEQLNNIKVDYKNF